MTQTLGKRIAHHRKKLGMTQDALAERLGVTAQAVSKWENDQSCPDITTLPKLADIFGITTDSLLGIIREEVHVAQVIEDEDFHEQEGFRVQRGNWELHFDGDSNSAMLFPAMIVAIGTLMLCNNILHWDRSFWALAWPAALLVYGLFHLFPKFSFFPLGCTLFGGYTLLHYAGLVPDILTTGIMIPVVIILAGVSMLADAAKKPKKPSVHVHCDDPDKYINRLDTQEDTFSFTSSFGETTQIIPLSHLRKGVINVSFGEFCADLRQLESVSEDNKLVVNCSFGALRLLIPKKFTAHDNNTTFFSSIQVDGQPDSEPCGIIHLTSSASFGQIIIEYV